MNKKTKNLINALLLAFVIASAAYLVAEQIRSRSQAVPTETPELQSPQPAVTPAVSQGVQPPISSTSQLSQIQSEPKPQEKPADSKVVVYYFYGNVRCPTCRKFEAYTKEALDEAFTDELLNGQVNWQMVNVENSENRHFINDYQLYTKTIIVAEFQDNKQLRWKNLKKIWRLVGNKREFFDYIQSEVHNYLREQ
jgi:hypothetical protein